MELIIVKIVYEMNITINIYVADYCLLTTILGVRVNIRGCSNSIIGSTIAQDLTLLDCY